MEGRPSDAESSSDESDQEIWAEIRRDRREKRIEEQGTAKSYPLSSVMPTFTISPSTLKPTATVSRCISCFVCMCVCIFKFYCSNSIGGYSDSS